MPHAFAKQSARLPFFLQAAPFLFIVQENVFLVRKKQGSLFRAYYPLGI